MNAFPWKTIILLADIFDSQASSLPPHERRDLEQTEPHLLAEVMGALREICADVQHVESVDAAIEAVKRRTDALLFSTFAGPPTRNRLLLAPATAEALQIPYVGLDAMGQAMAHDKGVAKRMALDSGLKTPPWRILRTKADTAACLEFPLPYVLKPIAEGTSIGIGPRSLVRIANDGVQLAQDLLDKFDQPVLLEGFAPGREASFVAIETTGEPHTAFVEIAVADDPTYFDHHLFDAGEKFKRKLPREVRLIDKELGAADREAIERLLHAVGHYGYVRVDGKLDEGRFSFLELTPDGWLGSTGQVAAGFMLKGWSYVDVLRAILLSARPDIRGRHSNG